MINEPKREDVFAFKVVRIKDVSFQVNENLFNHQKDPNLIKVNINCELKSNPEYSIIILEIFASYYYSDAKEGEILSSILVHNAFDILDLKRFFHGNVLRLPPDLLITLVSLSISHTRALFSKSIEGTVLGGIIMPLINPEEFSKTIFPDMFSGIGLMRGQESTEIIKEENKKTEMVKEKKKKIKSN